MKALPISTLIAISLASSLSSCINPTIDNPYKSIKNVQEYSLADFKPSKPIKFFKLRTYEYENNSIVRMYIDLSWMNEPLSGWYKSFDASAYSTLSESELLHFKSLKATVPSQGGFIHKTHGGGENHNIIADFPYPRVDNLFYIDHTSKAGVITNHKDLQKFFANIDTEAELAMMVWSYSLLDVSCYARTGSIYTLYSQTAKTSPANSKESYTKISVDIKGNILKKEKLQGKGPCHNL